MIPNKRLLKLGGLSTGIIVLIVLSIIWSATSKTSVNPVICTELKEYCKQHNLCESWCIVVDYSVYSGRDRLFLLDMSKNQIFYSDLCAHGIGKDFDCITKPKFSNEIGSNYSSLGHYKLGKQRKTTKYDLDCIELYGLDSTNSNAYTRGILIHNGLPDTCILGLPCLPLSQGCFTITNSAFEAIVKVKPDSNKPILLYCTDKSVF